MFKVFSWRSYTPISSHYFPLIRKKLLDFSLLIENKSQQKLIIKLSPILLDLTYRQKTQGKKRTSGADLRHIP